jgi:hypothetical protein
MKMRFAAVAIAASAIVLLSACGSDDDSSTTSSESSTAVSAAAADGPTTFAKGTDVELVGDVALGGQTLNITAEEEEGEVTGEFRISQNVFTLACADTDTDGVVILGGAATAGNEFVAEGGLHALIIKEGDPDAVSLYSNDVGAESCTALLESITDDKLANANDFVDVEDGYDIETG